MEAVDCGRRTFGEGRKTLPASRARVDLSRLSGRGEDSARRRRLVSDQLRGQNPASRPRHRPNSLSPSCGDAAPPWDHGIARGGTDASPSPRRFPQDLALSGVVGRADDAFLLHPLHQRGGAVVADLQAALDVGGRGLLVAQHDRPPPGRRGRCRPRRTSPCRERRVRPRRRRRLGLVVLVGGDRRRDTPARPASSGGATTFSTSSSETNGPCTRLDAAAAGHVEHVALAEQRARRPSRRGWCGCRSSTSPGRRCGSGSSP